MKRTGTTSLQTALIVLQRQLADAGVIYPKEWRRDGLAGYSTHGALVEVIGSPSKDHEPVRRFLQYLDEHADSSILLSSEFVTDWLADSKLEAVLRTLALAQAITPVTCIWTLRRLDERISSHRLRQLLLGQDFVLPGEGEVPELAASFAASLAGMKRIEDTVACPVEYVKYVPSGTHNQEILKAIDLPADVRSSIEEALSAGPRLNPQLTHKAAVAMCHRDALAERIGAPIGLSELQTAFFLGEFEFDDDRPCELMGHQVRIDLHERAMAAAAEQGMSEYVEFFGTDEIESRDQVPMDPSVLSDEDLQRLMSYLLALKQSDVRSLIRQRYSSVPVDRADPTGGERKGKHEGN